MKIINTQKKRFAYLGSVLVGFINGLLGAGGGMVLVPLLTLLTDLKEEELFASSIAVILPLCTVSLIYSAMEAPLPWQSALPYLMGSAAGGFLAGIYGRKMYQTWYQMKNMVQGGLDVSPVITHRFHYTEFEKGFEAMNSGKSGKVVLDWTTKKED